MAAGWGQSGSLGLALRKGFRVKLQPFSLNGVAHTTPEIQGEGRKTWVLIRCSIPRIFVTLIWHLFTVFNVLPTLQNASTPIPPQTQDQHNPSYSLGPRWPTRGPHHTLGPCLCLLSLFLLGPREGRPQLETTEAAHHKNWILKP